MSPTPVGAIAPADLDAVSTTNHPIDLTTQVIPSLVAQQDLRDHLVATGSVEVLHTQPVLPDTPDPLLIEVDQDTVAVVDEHYEEEFRSDLEDALDAGWTPGAAND